MTASAAWLRPTALAWVVVTALLLLIAAPSIAAKRFPDPDDVLRLVQVRDLLAGQLWFDLTQHRLDAPGGGVPMHWSRLVDIPLAGLILVLAPLFGQPLAESITLVAVPLLVFACALLLVGRQAARLCGAASVPYACLALALSVPVLSQVLRLPDRSSRLADRAGPWSRSPGSFRAMRGAAVGWRALRWPRGWRSRSKACRWRRR